jgi:tetratricopeptide (TPR) repeat protein
MGTLYLENKNYTKGEATFRIEVAQNPDSPEANFYLGRFLMAQKKPEQALPYLKKASLLDRKDLDYLFWNGLALGELGKASQEREVYQKILKINQRHSQALIYLGHNQFREKEYEAALETYQKVLAIWPYSPPALYNRALIGKILNLTSEEKAGWLAYLSAYPSGQWAIKATGHLNMLGDFSYRNHHLGSRTITLKKIEFVPFSDKLTQSSRSSLKEVGATVSNTPIGKLQVVVFLENNKKLARSRAVAIKRYLLESFSELPKNRVSISWFDQPEKLKLQGVSLKNPESVLFFLTGLERVIKPGNKKKKPLAVKY